MIKKSIIFIGILFLLLGIYFSIKFQLSYISTANNSASTLNTTSYSDYSEKPTVIISAIDTINSKLNNQIVSIIELRSYPEKYLGKNVKVRGILKVGTSPRCLMCEQFGQTDSKGNNTTSTITQIFIIPDDKISTEQQNIIQRKRIQPNVTSDTDSLLICSNADFSASTNGCHSICNDINNCGNLNPGQPNVIDVQLKKNDADYFLIKV